MIHLLHVVDLIADADTTILLQGETGTGKEWLARRIHASGSRSNRPFVTVHCGAIPEGLAEAALFGHEKGAFTGAIRSARGHFEMAQGGTLFLDEIGEIPPAMQVKLLRVLQDHTFQPVGSERSVHVDVRVMAATNRDLAEAVNLGSFRSDLYYRLAVIILDVPPLRERVEEIPDLAREHVQSLAARHGLPVPRIAAAAMDAMKRYSWPGNVRELINVLERGLLLSPSETLRLENLSSSIHTNPPPKVGGGEAADAVASAPSVTTFAQARAEAVARFEVSYLTSLLRSMNGHIGDAAELGGIPPRTLNTLMRKHGLNKKDFRSVRGAHHPVVDGVSPPSEP